MQSRKQPAGLFADPVDYLNPEVPGRLPRVELPLVRATPAMLDGYGELVGERQGFEIEIVPWPKTRRRTARASSCGTPITTPTAASSSFPWTAVPS